jgi:deoxyribonuclease I
LSKSKTVRLGIVAVTLLLGIYLGTPADAYKKPAGEYFNILPLFWSKLYADGGETLYCARKFGPNKGRSINIEHVFPMSWTLKKFGCRDREQCRKSSKEFNRVEADMHNLYPARQDINQARGSSGFAMVKGEKREFGQCDIEIDRRHRRVEPRPKVRGNIARAMFYMHNRYGLTIFKKQAALLKQWHKEDPPDKEERRRNDAIEKIQGTRNQFIDQPRLVYKLTF